MRHEILTDILLGGRPARDAETLRRVELVPEILLTAPELNLVPIQHP